MCNINESMQATENVVADSYVIDSNVLRLQDEIDNKRRRRDTDLAESLKPLRAIDHELERASTILGLRTTVGAFSWDRADSSIVSRCCILLHYTVYPSSDSSLVSRIRQAGDACTRVVDEEFLLDMITHCLDGIQAFDTILNAARDANRELKGEQPQDEPALGGDQGGSGDGPGDGPAVGGVGGGVPPAAGTPPPRQDTQQQSGTGPQHLPESSNTPAAPSPSGSPLPRVHIVGM